jgi:hypothetical protein
MNKNDLAFHIELAQKAIDENFGNGYAKAHPEVLAAQLKSAALGSIGDKLDDIAGQLCAQAQFLSDIQSAISSLEDKHGVVANALLQLADRHGSTTPGPF